MTRMTNIPHNYLSNTIKCLSLSLSLASSLSLPPIMLHLRQGLVSGYQADPLHQLNITNAHLGRFNRFEFGILAPANTKNYSNFGDLGVIEFSSPTPRNRRWCSDSGSSSIIEFSTMSSLEDESDVSSPPLWKTSLPATPTTMASVLHLSPTAQSQESARGHRELMEMIRNMPESAYDLSLKDIVELSTAQRFSSQNVPSICFGSKEEELQQWYMFKSFTKASADGGGKDWIGEKFGHRVVEEKAL